MASNLLLCKLQFNKTVTKFVFTCIIFQLYFKGSLLLLICRHGSPEGLMTNFQTSHLMTCST